MAGLVYTPHRGGNVPQPTCPHLYLDATNSCLDCGTFVESASVGHAELCIYCCTEPVNEQHHPYCSAYCGVMAQAS